MTTHHAPRPELAHRPDPTTGTADVLGEEVRTVAPDHSRRPRRRAREELSESDRAVLLETQRQRRRHEALRQSIENDRYWTRTLR